MSGEIQIPVLFCMRYFFIQIERKENLFINLAKNLGLMRILDSDLI